MLETVANAGSRLQAAAAGASTRSGAPTAEAEVFRTGVPLWLHPEALARRFPGSSKALLAGGAGSWLGVPVPGNDDIDAVLSVAFPSERAFTRGDRARLALLAEECASVLSGCSEHDAGAAARATALTAAGAPPADAFVVQYGEGSVDGPVGRILGVFTSETSARDAVRALDLTRSLVSHASITSWSLDVPRLRTRVEIDLPE